MKMLMKGWCHAFQQLNWPRYAHFVFSSPVITSVQQNTSFTEAQFLTLEECNFKKLQAFLYLNIDHIENGLYIE